MGNQIAFAGPYGTELMGPYGTSLAQATAPKKFVGMYPWQWMFLGGAALLTATGAYVAHYGGKKTAKKRAVKAAAIGGLGGAVAGGLFAFALGKA